MNIKNFVILIILVNLFSCAKKTEKRIEKQNQSWEKLEVITQFQKISIEKNSDSSDVENIIWNKGIYKIPPKYIIEDTVNTKIYLTNDEKDSLKTWILSSIQKTKFTNKNASDYVGNVKLIFTYLNTSISCEYRSVGAWNEVSENTQKIYTLLNSKTEISQQ